jgi:peptidoglycan/LPS O-acetylase OafA/YrhL
MLPYGSHSWSFSVIILSAATIIATFALDHEPLSTAAAVLSAPLRLVGRYSYELYLIHGVMIMAIDAVIVKFGGFTPMPITLHGVTLTPGIPALAIYFALTITVAVALGRFFSEPMNRYLRSIQLPILTGRGECSDQNNGN